MKNYALDFWTAGKIFLPLILGGLLSGCGQTGSGLPYSELPKPKTGAFTEWEPLFEAEEPSNSANRQTDSPATTLDQTTSSESTEPVSQTLKSDQSPESTIQQAAGQVSDSAAEVTPAVAVTQPPTTEASADMLSPDLTANERRNLLMNNPGLEENIEVLEIKLLIPEKRFRKEDGGKVVRVSYDDIDLLKVLNMQPVPADAADHFPDWLSDLDGQHVRIRGFMIPPFQAKGLKRFALARDNGICCFVRTPKIYDVIDVRMAEGQTTHYIANTPFDVEGIFRIQPVADDGELYKLYKIEDATVIE